MIRELDLQTQLKLRSGIVIDSLDSAVRELLQNSVDAGASDITIKVDLASLSVCVEDNGHGILQDQLPLVGLRYHTSKAVLGPLFGFRGEALSSLADSCNSLVITSKTTADAHLKSIVIGGTSSLSLVDVVHEFFRVSFGNHCGTVCIATGIFGPSPVRWQAEDRNNKTAIRNLKAVLFECLFFHPRVTCKLMFGDSSSATVAFTTALVVSERSRDRLDLFTSLYGAADFDEVCALAELVSLRLFISKRPTQKSQFRFMFLNKRKLVSGNIRRHVLSLIARSAYLNAKGYLGRAMKWYPSFIFFIDAPAVLDDLVQSPAKHIIAPSEENTIFALLRQTLGEYLGLSAKPTRKNASQSQTSDSVRDSVSSSEDSDVSSEDSAPPPSQISSRVFEEPWRVLGQICQRFILLKLAESLCVVDQHAADERVTFEALVDELLDSVRDRDRDIRVQLTHPMEMDTTTQQKEELISLRLHMWKYGFDFESSSCGLVVTHLPAVLIPRAADSELVRTCLLQHVHDIHQREKSTEISDNWFAALKNVPRGLAEALVVQSCSLAIKFGDNLDLSEQEFLIGQLSRCHIPFQCAHGRPTVYPLTEAPLPVFNDDTEI